MSDKKQLGDLLVEAGIITMKTLERALERQKGSGKRLGQVLEEMGVINGDELIDALSKQFAFKTVRGFADYAFPPELLALVPQDIAVQKQVFPIKQKDNMLALAVNDPFDVETIDFLAKKNGVQIIPVLATRQDLLAAIEKHYLHGKAKDSQRQKILVVEDTPPVATIIQVALHKEGFDVLLAGDGVEGLKTAVVEKPDLIICDSVMPRMDGFSLMRAVRSNPTIADTPMILLTSKATGEDEQRALEAGFIDFIAKPVQPIRIVTRVRRAFDLLKRFK
ncbi:response regulator [Geobacter sulfurreducens]|uniref:Response regulator, GspIIEN domain-containing n=1 Tax=Geobacter sulfurreducens (strain ATCC 51573 / DSM 12127 / PCA) TaxID=243231 RepID=Q74DU5_GEOSL|nr:response regulator [Geobacter sulfurreducens]AAR34596.1 response regulator, GspIIEN domain-containing [Geobacter sulfurreducens PCA]ADI84055.1 response regulator, GspIIEN domain-containing [Geobacter sulfurreducens KN400]UAC05250.1 response regulator [Geobacter sulfurreducens]UTG93888.1 response regulator [Geobacter sulfurreducens]BBA69744.1 Alkaline phosphatase synthesis transcriptional regulatory protein PhoP [Geobacter sulfurreducens]